MTNHKTMKEHALTERPVEKCLQMGPKALSDAELLAVVIRSGSRGETAKELAERVLSLSACYPGLNGLKHLTSEELKSLPGIGQVKAVQLICLSEIARRMAKEVLPGDIVMTNPADIAAFFMEDMRHNEREELRVVFFDTRSRYIGDKVLFQGTVNASLVSPREVFVEALKYQAVYLCLLHNHPSGSITPSNEDIRFTSRIKDVGEKLGIRLVDHIIIAGRDYFSFMQQRIL